MLLDKLFAWLISRCNHDSRTVVADILSGELATKDDRRRYVQWCMKCGAYRFVGEALDDKGSLVTLLVGHWRRPRVDW